MDLRHTLGTRVDPASFVAFRVGFGLLATAAAIRFVAYGWVDAFLVQPTWHFAWLEGVVEPPAPVLYAMFAVQAIAGMGIAFRVAPRVSVALWLAAFGYVELIDKALYLNHYVLFTLLGATMLAAPIHRIGTEGCPRWVLWLLRIELGLVWVWAGLAKINGDWLLRAEPLTTWLQALADLPLVGPILAWDPTAYAMSWGGMAYDLTVPFLLLHPRTRAVGVVLLLGFHATVGLLFPIGIFPWLMVLGASLFLDPGWPRHWMPQSWSPDVGEPLSTGASAMWVAAVAVLALFPGRFLLEGADVSWSERGHRLAWRVLLNEKTGLVDYRVVEPDTAQTWRVLPSEELTELQHEQLRTQPDLIRQYALHLAERHAAEGRRVEVYADAWASLNGRPAQRLIRPDVDLTRPLAQLEEREWIVPLERDGW